MGYIYVMTNPALKGMVKIGYANNVEQRRCGLSTSALPYDYEVYATYETAGNLEDKKLHKLIDTLNPDLRVSHNREFYVMEPNEAYELLKAIATISNTQNRLHCKFDDNITTAQKVKRPAIDFYECGLHYGDKLVYIDDPNIVVTIVEHKKVSYKGEITSLSRIVQDLRNMKAAQGPAFFTFNGEPLVDIADRTQWKDFK